VAWGLFPLIIEIFADGCTCLITTPFRCRPFVCQRPPNMWLGGSFPCGGFCRWMHLPHQMRMSPHRLTPSFWCRPLLAHWSPDPLDTPFSSSRPCIFRACDSKDPFPFSAGFTSGFSDLISRIGLRASLISALFQFAFFRFLDEYR